MSGKLSSHMWFFSGFCKTLQPEFTCLIDCGTVPDDRGVFNYFRVLETNPQVGGVCGYMGCRIPWCPTVFALMRTIFCCESACFKKSVVKSDLKKKEALKKKKSDADQGKKKCSFFYCLIWFVGKIVFSFGMVFCGLDIRFW